MESNFHTTALTLAAAMAAIAVPDDGISQEERHGIAETNRMTRGETDRMVNVLLQDKCLEIAARIMDAPIFASGGVA